MSEAKYRYWVAVHNKLFDDIKNDRISHRQALRRQNELYLLDSGDNFINPFDLENLIECKYVTGEEFKPLFEK